MDDTSDIFRLIAKASSEMGLGVLVIGGHAVNAYGYTRTTLDLDFLVCADDLAAWRTKFESFGYCWVGQTNAFAKFLPERGSMAPFPVDLMLVDHSTWELMSSRKRTMPFGQVSLQVPDPLHLIALKLHAMRNAERRMSGKDLPDILQILRICNIDPDGAAFQAVLDRHANDETRFLLKTFLESG